MAIFLIFAALSNSANKKNHFICTLRVLVIVSRRKARQVWERYFMDTKVLRDASGGVPNVRA